MTIGVIDPTFVPVTVLMYHAVGQPDAANAATDPQYTVSDAAFFAQLTVLQVRRRRMSSLQRLLASGVRERRVAITFDDGHESNARAADLIAMCGGTADFFINPSTIGRPGFLDWPAVRRMAAFGHSIQSHGLTHRHLDALGDEEVRRELRESKARIEHEVGVPVTLFAPPGGRLRPGVARLAQEAGYGALCNSRSALWRDADDHWHIPRLAVMSGLDLGRFERWICQDEWELARMQARYFTLQCAKRVLGRGTYERVRNALLGTPVDERTSVS